MRQCLTDAEIQGFLRSGLTEEQRQEVDEHLGDCSTCAERVERARGSSAAGHAIHSAGTQVEVTSAMEVHSRSGSQSHWTDGGISAAAGPECPPAAPSVSLDDFLSGLSSSGLLPASELANVREKSSKDPVAGTVAGLIQWLVNEHKLTRYQADIIARGNRGGLVIGNYIILEKLGQGGMGTVFKARHRRMNRLVALKVLPQALSSVPEAILRFQREVEAAARLQHPNIAAAYDADEASGVHFLVMECVDGPNLANYIKQRGPLPVAIATRLTIQAALGLATAHAQGVVHRDIKPSNIMVNKQGVLKILDMGLAQMRGSEANLDLTSDVTQTGRVMGTIDYMAPEQARDAKNVDLRADIYSLGCTLFFLATGKTPAPGGSAAEKLLWHQTQPAEPLSLACPQSTPKLDAVLLKMMAKKAEERQQTMQAVAEELEQCLAELPPADNSALIDGLDLVSEHATSTMQGSRYHQQTMGGTYGDTIVSAPGHGSVPRPTVAPAAKKSRLLIYSCGLAGLGVLALILAAPYLGMVGGGGGDAVLLVKVDGGPADVLVNSELRGRAGENGQPLELKVKPGAHLVQVKREGFEPFEQKVEAAEGKPAEVAALLRKLDNKPGVPAVALPSPHAPYEKLLTWVFRNKGRVTANNQVGEQIQLTSLAQLTAINQPLEILGIKLDGTGVKDADLEMLQTAKGLRELSLADTQITDEGLAKLLELQQLTHLNLSKTSITSTGLQQIRRLSNLLELNLEKTGVTDPGVVRLLVLSKLERLYLSDTGVTDTGLEQLKGLRSLKQLTLHGTGLTQTVYTSLKTALPQLDIAWDGADVERGLALRLLEKKATLAVVDRSGQRHEALKAAESLPPGRVTVKAIDLSTGSNFSDDDLKQIGLLPEIESLSLAGTKVTSEGLANLQGLTSLKKLDLGTPRLAPAALESLRKALPGCQVVIREPADVEVARLICKAGGRVNVFTERNQLIADISSEASLPVTGYLLRAIKLDDVAGIDDSILEKITELPGLESLFLANTAVTDAGIGRIAACKSLQELTLSGTKVTPAGLVLLTQLPKLTRLYVANTQIGGEGLRQIGDLPGLTHLSLQGLKLTDDDLAPLKRLRQLEWLDLSATPLSDAALVHLSKLVTLRELHVTTTKLTDAGQEELATALGKNCRLVAEPLDPQRLAARWLISHSGTVALDSGKLANVKDLPRTACRVVAIDLAELAQLKRGELTPYLAACKDVVSLNLSETQLVESDLSFLNSMPALREVRLVGLPLSDKTLELLAAQPSLEIIDLSGTRVSGQALAQLSKAPNLRELYLANTLVDDRYFAALEAFPKLEALDVSAVTSVTDAGIASITPLQGLKILRLRRSKLTDAGLEKLASLPNLEELDLEGVKITDGGVAKLAGLTKLRQIGLANTTVTEGVTSTLGQMKQLKSINLARTKISAESIKQLQAALPGCSIIAPSLAPRNPNNPAGDTTGAGGGGFRSP